MKIEKLAEIIEKTSPLDLQEQWDNSGFQIKFDGAEIKKVLVAMEITDEVIDEAELLEVGAIVTHHPLIFDPVRRVYDNEIAGNHLVRLIKNDINVYSSHTPFDKCAGGNNDYLAGLLDLHDVKIMETDPDGFCRTGLVRLPAPAGEYAAAVCDRLGIDRRSAVFCGDPGETVKKAGLCTGAGADYIEKAKEAGCDIFITGDVKYHQAQSAREMGVNVLDIGHYGSEKIFTENMAGYLRENTTLAVIESAVSLDPFVLL